MTTYLLHGGAELHNRPGNPRFYKRILELVAGNEVRILLCLWSRPKDQWEQRRKQLLELIQSETNKKVIVDTIDDPTSLQSTVPNYDAFFLAGGDAERLESYYPNLDNLKNIVQKKIYIGTSMGAFIVSNSYVFSYSAQKPGVQKGLGILPINTLCHWDIEKSKTEKLELLQKGK